MSNSHDHPVNEDPLKTAQNGRSGENLGPPEPSRRCARPDAANRDRSNWGRREQRVKLYNCGNAGENARPAGAVVRPRTICWSWQNEERATMRVSLCRTNIEHCLWPQSRWDI